MNPQEILNRFLNWRQEKISDRSFIIILSIVIGLASGMAAVIIKNTVFLIKHLLTSQFYTDYQNYLYFIYPIIGILITIMFKQYILRQYIGDGVPTVLYAISKNNGLIRKHNMFSSMIASSLTVGFGGSVGLEGPTVVTGAAIGSNIGRVLHMNYRQITLLIAFASAGAMSAIFKSPIAAIVFALEVIMLDLTMASLIPLLIASVTGALTSYFFLGQDVLYPFDVQESFIMADIPFFLLLGIFTGLISVYFTRIYMLIGRIFSGISTWYYRLLIGGAFLGLIIFLFPALYGEGYEAINACLKGDYSPLFDESIFFPLRENHTAIFIIIFLVILLKVVAASITFGSGGIGGIFAPTLFMGAFSGLFFAEVINYSNLSSLHLSNFALVGMSGMIAGVIHAPLTAIFLIAEITSGYELFMPLMITSTISFLTVRVFEKNSVYTIQLAKRGELMTHNKDKVVLSLMKISELIEKDFSTIPPEATLGDLVRVITTSKRNIFPVVDEKNRFYGMIILDNIRDIMFRQELYKTTFVKNLMIKPYRTIDPSMSMEEVAQIFHDTDKYNLPVIQEGKYIGFISRANVFHSYRKLLKDFSDD